MYYIYIIQNLTNDKVYVGRTKSGPKRLRNHKYCLNKQEHKNEHLQRAWNKHGEDSFDFWVLSEYVNREEVDKAEIFYIEWFKELGLCYNIQNGGEGPGKHSDETKKKMRQAKLGKPISEEHRLKIQKYWAGRPRGKYSEERIAKRVTTMRPIWDDKIASRPPKLTREEINLRSYEGRLKYYKIHGHPMEGKTHSDEAKAKIKEARALQIITEESNKKRSETLTGKSKGGKEYKAFGESKTIAQWSKDYRCIVSRSTLVYRIQEKNWDPEEAITTPNR